MKRKAVILFLSIGILSGCTQVSSDMPASISEGLLTVSTQTVTKPNRNKTYYSYYAEPSVGRYASYDTGNIFCYQGTKFLMNLNVPVIINSEIYPQSSEKGVEALGSPVTNLTGSYIDFDEIKRQYELKIYELDASYLIVMNTDVVNFCAVCANGTAVQLTSEMLKIARSVQVNKETLITAYTNHKTLNYTAEKVQLYNEIVPESGNVNELLDDTNTLGQGSGTEPNGTAKTD